MIISYRDTLADGRVVLVEANYQEPVYTPGAEEPEHCYVVRILDQAMLDDLSKDVSRDRADLRLQLAKDAPAEYQRLRRECLERVLYEMDVVAGETGSIARDARATGWTYLTTEEAEKVKAETAGAFARIERSRS